MQPLLRFKMLKLPVSLFLGHFPIKTLKMASFNAEFLNNDCIFVYDINWSVIRLSRNMIPKNFVTIQPFLKNSKGVAGC